MISSSFLEGVGFAAGQADVFIDDVDVIKRRSLPSSPLICVDAGDVLGPAFAGDDHLVRPRGCRPTRSKALGRIT
jgi:hypothetical protein